MGRMLATVKAIEEVKEIPNADRIQAYRVGGWWVVGKKNEYQVGDKAVYCEIDSWIPNKIAPFLSNNNKPREFNGIVGERLRTIKLRGQISQGLLLPLTILKEYGIQEPKENTDYSELLGIVKWERPIPASLSGTMKGDFPHFIHKTRQERVQNLDLTEYHGKYILTEKLDGSSMTVYFHEGEMGVCSRNIELKESEDNSFWRAARSYDLKGMFEANKHRFNKPASIAIQGELIGEGIQGNPYKVHGHRFVVFDVWDINRQEYLEWNDVKRIAKFMGLTTVPEYGILEIDKNITVQCLVDYADEILSIYKPNILAEGLVFKDLENADRSFKVISNSWLMGK